LPTPEDRLKTHEVPVKDSFRLPFAWPASALREGRVTLPDFDAFTPIKSDSFKDPATGWPQGKTENKGFVTEREYKDGTYVIHKEFNGGYSYGGSSRFVGLTNFVCQVDGRVVDDAFSTSDLWFGNDQQRKAVVVRLNGTGKCHVVLWDYDKGDQALLLTVSHPAIKKGNKFNKLTVIYTADQLEVYVNGVAVCDPVVVPLSLQPVRIALGASGQAKSTTEFQKLSTWSADGLPSLEERSKTNVVPPK
jgi:hypothetical protein